MKSLLKLLLPTNFSDYNKRSRSYCKQANNGIYGY
jgi:hypothetical protein